MGCRFFMANMGMADHAKCTSSTGSATSKKGGPLRWIARLADKFPRVEPPHEVIQPKKNCQKGQPKKPEAKSQTSDQ